MTQGGRNYLDAIPAARVGVFSVIAVPVAIPDEKALASRVAVVGPRPSTQVSGWL